LQNCQINFSMPDCLAFREKPLALPLLKTGWAGSALANADGASSTSSGGYTECLREGLFLAHGIPGFVLDDHYSITPPNNGSCHEFHQKLECKEPPCRSLKQFSASLPFSKAGNAHCFGFWDAVVFVRITKSPGVHIASGAPKPRQILRQSPLKIPAKGWGEQLP
jgi:hypothetical protein